MLLEIVAVLVAVICLLKFVSTIQATQNRPKNGVFPASKIPGMKPSHPEEGNKPDIKKEKVLSDFLIKLHKKYGPIASFWEDKKMSVSIASPELFKEVRHLYDVPTDLFPEIEMISGPEALTNKHSDEVRRRRKLYEHHFMMKACRSHSVCFLEVAQEAIKKWENLKKDETLPLHETLAKMSLSALARTSFGDYFKKEDNLMEYQKHVDFAFKHIDPVPERGTELYKELESHCDKIKQIVQKVLDDRRRTRTVEEEETKLFIDVLLSDEFTDEERLADSSMFIAAGYDTNAMFASWTLYEMMLNHDIQETARKELFDVLGDAPCTLESIPKLRYLRHCIDETLRVYMRKFFSARIAEDDMKLGGYSISKGTRIYIFSGYTFWNPNIWKDHEKYNPDRFSAENSKDPHAFAFKPFGFAGKRVCPGQNFAYTEMTIFLAEWLRHFRFRLPAGQKVELLEGTFIVPKDEIKITLENLRESRVLMG